MTVLVIYKKLIDAPHALLNDYYEERSEIVEVNELTDLNGKFNQITKVYIIEN